MRVYSAIGAITGWFAVLAQFYLILLNATLPVFQTIIKFFSYFTILTNILVAVCFTILFLKPKSAWGKFFTRPKVLTATAAYITIVGVVYNTVLRYIWDPQGLQWIVDELLHSVIPLFFVCYWFMYVFKNELEWRDVLYWLLYPLIYLIWIGIRGVFLNDYPYPFLDVNTLGYPNVLMNSMLVFIFFLFVSLFFIAISKMVKRRTINSA